MKRIIYIYIIFILFSSCNTQEETTPEVKKDPILVKVEEKYSSGDSYITKYRYDNSKRLIEATTSKNLAFYQTTFFTYNSNNNISNISYNYGYQQEGSFNFEYLDNVVNILNIDNQIVKKYTIDNYNLVTTIDEIHNNNTVTSSLTYDSHKNVKNIHMSNIDKYNVFTYDKDQYHPLRNIKTEFFYWFPGQENIFRFTKQDLTYKNNMLSSVITNNADEFKNEFYLDYIYNEDDDSYLKGYPSSAIKYDLANDISIEYIFYYE